MFAIEAVTDIARQPLDRPVPSRDITSRQGIPPRYLEQVLQKLVKAGILSGIRGPKGGYRLARERRRITLADIVRAVEEVAPGREATAGGTVLHRQVIAPVWQVVQAGTLQRLDEISIEDLCLRAQAAGLDEGVENPLDFII